MANRTMKLIKTGNSIACEYIARSEGGKHTLVNTYSGEIVVREFPARIPLAFYIELILDEGFSGHMEFRLIEGGKPIANVEAELHLEPSKMGLIVLPAFVFSLSAETEVEVVASAVGYRKRTLVRQKISLGPVPE